MTALKGYPASMPRDFGKISASGKVEMLTETYYQWLQYLKQQFGQAHRSVKSAYIIVSPSGKAERQYKPHLYHDIAL